MTKQRILYLDMISGVAGDMFVGAMLEVGVPFALLSEAIDSLGLKSLSLKKRRVSKCGIGATQFTVKDGDQVADKASHSHHGHGHDHAHSHSDGHAHHVHRGLDDIKKIIKRGKFSQSVKDRAINIFTCLGKAEAKVHRTTLKKIHFHEVGALDAIADIVCAAVAVEYLALDKIVASPFLLGTGHVHCAHGVMPVPVPATMEIVQGCPVVRKDRKREMTTPTGAAIIKTLCDEFSETWPVMDVLKTGYGAGNRSFEDYPNVLRAMIGTRDEVQSPLCMLECTIDDMNPQLFESLFDDLQQQGAMEVHWFAVQAKKNRPAWILRVLCEETHRERLEVMVFEQTTTLGIRRFPMDRRVLQRRFKTRKFRKQTIRIKEGLLDGCVVNQMPEYEDCKKAALNLGIPVKAVYMGLSSEPITKKSRK